MYEMSWQDDINYSFKRLNRAKRIHQPSVNLSKACKEGEVSGGEVSHVHSLEILRAFA